MTTLAELDDSFERAITPVEYASVRAKARGWSAPGSLQAAIVAADCSFFIVVADVRGASDAETGGLLADLARAATLLASATPPADLLPTNRFASLANDVCTLGNFGRDAGWSNEPLWAAITIAVEAALPEDFSFSSAIFGLEAKKRTITGARTFAALSFLYGRAEVGVRRCRRLLDTLYMWGDPVNYFVTAYRVRDLLAECLQAKPVLFSAVFEIQAAVANHVDQFRARRRSRAGRLLLSQLFATLLDQFVSDLAEPAIPEDWQRKGPATEAFYDAMRERLFSISEHGRSRLLLDQLAIPFMPFASAIEAAEAAIVERRLLALPPRRDPGSLESRLVSRLPAVVWQDPRQSPTAEAEYRNRFRDVIAFEASMASADAGFVDFARVADLENVQAELGSGEALLVYAISRETLHPARQICIIATTSERTRHVLVNLDVLKTVPWLYDGYIGASNIDGAEPLEVSPLGELVVWIRRAIRTDSPEASPALRLLYLLLVKPLEEIGITPIAFRHWFIVASGPLRALPFGVALSDSGSYLAQNVALSFPPSASTWLTLRTEWKEPQRFVGLGNPALDRQHWPGLPNAALEIKAAARRLSKVPSSLFFCAKATLETLRKEAPKASILHLATHGEFPEADVIDLHHILLTPSEGDDGIVSAELLRGLQLERVQLLVLSVCNGALLRFGPGEELHGLLSAALGAGAANIVTTLWPINDGMAAVWMQSFYKHLLRAGPSLAAQLAVCALIDDGAALRDWAPFVVVGATRNPVVSS